MEHDDRPNAGSRPFDDLCTCVKADCGYSTHHMTPRQCFRLIQRETRGSFAGAFPLCVCLISGTISVLIWMPSMWTCVRMYPRQLVIIRENTHDKETNREDRQTHTKACDLHREALLSLRHRADILIHSCESKLIPPALLPRALSYTLPPPHLTCPTLLVLCVHGRLEQQKVALCKWAQTRQIDTQLTYWSRIACFYL